MSDLHSQYNDVERLIDEEQFEAAIDGLKGIADQDDTFVLAHFALSRVLQVGFWLGSLKLIEL